MAGDYAVERFELPDLYGEVASRYRPADLERFVRALCDPGAARQTVHWGRNYLFATDLETATGPLPVVVKQFRNEGLVARLRRRTGPSKAERSWRAARHLVEAGVATPEPVAWIESAATQGPSFYVSRQLEGYFESRFYFRAVRDGSRRERYPDVDEEALFSALGRAVRALHDAGVWHRDVSIGNLLVRGAEDGGGKPPEIEILDLNRARLGVRLSLWRRIRDLCRLPILEKAHRRAYLTGYWGTPPPAGRELLFLAAARGFLLKNRLKAWVRHPVKGIVQALRPRRAHPHIPSAPAGVQTRDKAVWDALSDQPHQHASRVEKYREYLGDVGIHLKAVADGLPKLPAMLLDYRRRRRRLYGGPVAWGEMGVGVRPQPGGAPELLAALDALGSPPVLLRLHPWEAEHGDELELARELHARGYDLVYSLPQKRELVTDPAAWRAAVERLADAFSPYGRAFQVGQAVNRSKWGIWNYREYLELAATACEVLRARGDVAVLGPAVIDFEFYATAGLLNMRHPGVSFDVAAHLLYVDRRGAPENTQLGLDTVGKVVMMQAIAATSRNCAPRSWITEVNWPLWEGPHSPAGRDVSVDEESQASFLVRYYLLALGTGEVERVYWWQVMARGYGLVDPKGSRRRPSFHAFAQMNRRLEGSTFLGPLPTPEHVYLYRFRDRDGGALVVGWTVDGPADVALAGVEAVEGRDGEPLDHDGGERVRLEPAPRYFSVTGAAGAAS